jgi:hypothetical protein
MTDLKVIDGGDNGSSSPEPEPTDERKAAFSRAYREYLLAEAAIAKNNAGDDKCATNDEAEEMTGRLCDRRTAAEWQLIRTQPFCGWQLLEKFAVLETIVSRAEHEGNPHDKRHVFMLTSIKADLWKFRLERYGD